MRAYTVHAPPGAGDAPDRYAFVKDGFSWPALFWPLIWILWHRLWLTLMCAVIAVLVLIWVDLLAGSRAATLVWILGALLFAFEANNIRRLSLDRRGWRELGGSFGKDLQEAEVRFFQKWTEARSAAQPASTHDAAARGAVVPARVSDPDEPVFGLFPEPER